MPITRAFWNKSRALDFHVLKGESSPDLRQKHVAVTKLDGENETAGDYLNDTANNNDITVVFKPLIRGAPKAAPQAHIFAGGGVEVDTRTGIVKVNDPLPNPHLRNFIMRNCNSNAVPPTSSRWNSKAHWPGHGRCT